MYKVVKCFEFEAAHQLCNTINEGCKRIHGHTYKLEVELQSEDLNEEFMVCDFTRLSEIVKREVISVFDHKLILNGNCDFTSKEDVVLLPEQPTAEYMCRIIFALLIIFFPKLHRIRLWETSSSFAEYVR